MRNSKLNSVKTNAKIKTINKNKQKQLKGGTSDVIIIDEYSI